MDVGANIGLVPRQLKASDRCRWTGAGGFEPETGNLGLLRFSLSALPGMTIEAATLSCAQALRLRAAKFSWDRTVEAYSLPYGRLLEDPLA